MNSLATGGEIWHYDHSASFSKAKATGIVLCPYASPLELWRGHVTASGSAALEKRAVGGANIHWPMNRVAEALANSLRYDMQPRVPYPAG